MNVRRFTARSSREALSLVREALGEDAVVLSTRPCTEGVEILAMAPEGMLQVERMAAPATLPTVASTAPAGGEGREGRQAAAHDGAVADDVAALSMSTLSFQDYVRERLLRRRRAAIANDARLEAQAPAQRARRTSAHVPAAREAAAFAERVERAAAAFADTAGAAPAARPRRAAPTRRSARRRRARGARPPRHVAPSRCPTSPACSSSAWPNAAQRTAIGQRSPAMRCASRCARPARSTCRRMPAARGATRT